MKMIRVIRSPCCTPPPPPPLIPPSPLLRGAVTILFLFFLINADASAPNEPSRTLSATVPHQLTSLTELNLFLNAILRQPAQDVPHPKVPLFGASPTRPPSPKNPTTTKNREPQRSSGSDTTRRTATTIVRSSRGMATVASRSRVAQALSSFSKRMM